MSNITWPNKNTGDSVSAADMNQIKTATNSKSDTGHTHVAANITDFNAAALAAAPAETSSTILTKIGDGSVIDKSKLPPVSFAAPLVVDETTQEVSVDPDAIADWLSGGGGGSGVTTFATFAAITGLSTPGIIKVTADENYSNAVKFYIFDGTNLYPQTTGTAVAPPVANVAPVASSVAFTGTPTEGQTLTGTHSYSDANGDAQGASIFKWFNSVDTNPANRVLISGATSENYVLQSSDVDKRMWRSVTPVAATGTTTGTEVFSSYSAVIAAASAGGESVSTWENLSSGASADSEGTLTGGAFAGGGQIVGLLGVGSLFSFEIPTTLSDMGRLYLERADTAPNPITNYVDRYDSAVVKISPNGANLIIYGVNYPVAAGDRIQLYNDGTASNGIVARKVSGGVTTVLDSTNMDALLLSGYQYFIRFNFFTANRLYKPKSQNLI